jgi:hypothetical protein
MDRRLFDPHDSLRLPAIPSRAQLFRESRFFAKHGNVTPLSAEIMANYVASSQVVIPKVAEQVLPAHVSHVSPGILETVAQVLAPNRQWVQHSNHQLTGVVVVVRPDSGVVIMLQFVTVRFTNRLALDDPAAPNIIEDIRGKHCT